VTDFHARAEHLFELLRASGVDRNDLADDIEASGVCAGGGFWLGIVHSLRETPAVYAAEWYRDPTHAPGSFGPAMLAIRLGWPHEQALLDALAKSDDAWFQALGAACAAA